MWSTTSPEGLALHNASVVYKNRRRYDGESLSYIRRSYVMLILQCGKMSSSIGAWTLSKTWVLWLITILNLISTISLAVRKAILRSRLILKCFSSRNKDLSLKAYINYVRPILEYCSPVFGHRTLKFWYIRLSPFRKGYQVYGIFHIQSLMYMCICDK